MTLLRIEKFRSDLLDNERDIHLYLPSSYADGRNRRYPVLYVHDGQNAFHPAFNGQSWNLHRTAGRLADEGVISEIIIVGISNMGERRADEFTHDLDGVGYPYDKADIDPRGALYERFLAEELKPFVDALLRTQPEPEHNALLGSSRGGQVTYHIGIRRPDVFGMIGIMSPYLYYVDPADLSEVRLYSPMAGNRAAEPHGNGRLRKIWIDTGGREGLLIMEKHVIGLVKEFLAAGYEADRELAYYLDPEARHEEQDWERRTAFPLIHFFGNRGGVKGLALKPVKPNIMQGPGAYGRLIPEAEYEGGLRLTPLGGSWGAPGTGMAAIDNEGVIRSPRRPGGELEYRFEGLAATWSWEPLS